ncbi:MAG: class I SAM-dependent methyltransferase [Anaerolineae bacterium]|jgi:SAM-dependent methyltransferase|nr:class I SAM-dependent methyltransferase [Chloroflexota bacterium]
MKARRDRYDENYFNSVGDRLPLYRGIITRRYANLVREIAPGGGRLLELGCGDGRLLHALAGQYALTGIDISEHAIARARRLVPSANLRVGDIATCATDAHYDVVLALNVLEHVPDPRAVMLRVREMLAEGGTFIFAVPNKHGRVGRALVRFMDFMDRTHISSFTREHWLQLADELGFEQRLVLNATWFGPTRADFARSLAPILIVALYRQRAGQASSDEPPGDANDIAMVMADYPELLTGQFE